MLKGYLATAGVVSEFCFHVPVPVISKVPWRNSKLRFGDALPPEARRSEWRKPPIPDRDGRRF